MYALFRNGHIVAGTDSVPADHPSFERNLAALHPIITVMVVVVPESKEQLHQCLTRFKGRPGLAKEQMRLTRGPKKVRPADWLIPVQGPESPTFLV